MDDKSLGDLLKEFMETTKVPFLKKEFHDAWPVVAGPSLSACTVLESVSEKEGKIYVHATSISSRSLLMMERNRLVKDWNRLFPEKQIKEVVVTKRT